MMKLDAGKFGMAAAIVTAILWTICSAVVLTMPMGAIRMSGYMMHADVGPMTWAFSGPGFFVGLLVWAVSAGLVAWALAAVYNRLLGGAKADS